MHLDRADTDPEIERNLFARQSAADARQNFLLTLAQRAHSIGYVQRVRIAVGQWRFYNSPLLLPLCQRHLMRADDFKHVSRLARRKRIGAKHHDGSAGYYAVQLVFVLEKRVPIPSLQPTCVAGVFTFMIWRDGIHTHTAETWPCFFY